MSDPKAVLAEYNMPVPDGMDVKVVENADNCVHITMPAAPDGHHELSDEELSHAAGGAIMGLAAPRTEYDSVACDYRHMEIME
jgi:hypothetical protein